ncbi:hypothetical protein DFP72DRAFT_775241, partial [Ephemerocybe angulata]
REEAIQSTLEQIDKKLSEDQHEELARKLMYDEIEAALAKMPNRKAPGLDGIPTELWKVLHKHFTTQNKKPDAPQHSKFYVLALLQAAFNDVEENGVQPGANFAE